MPPMIRQEENDDVDNYFKLYGQILWLWSHSKLHCSWDVDIQSGLVMPATVLKQFQIIYDDNRMPTAYCSWALLSDKYEINYILNPSTIPLITGEWSKYLDYGFYFTIFREVHSGANFEIEINFFRANCLRITRQSN